MEACFTHSAVLLLSRAVRDSTVEMPAQKNSSKLAEIGCESWFYFGNYGVELGTPLPPPSERLDWRGFRKKCLQNLDPQGFRGQNLDNKQLAGFSEARVYRYRLDKNLLSFSRVKVGCHKDAVEIFSLSPDSNCSIFGLQIQLVGGRDIEGFVPGIDIAHCITAKFSRRVVSVSICFRNASS